MKLIDIFYKGLRRREPDKVSDEVRGFRLNTCRVCPELFEPTKQCKKCGCFVTLKTEYKNEQCPLGKW